MPLPRSNSYRLTLGGGRGYDVTLVDRATMQTRARFRQHLQHAQVSRFQDFVIFVSEERQDTL